MRSAACCRRDGRCACVATASRVRGAGGGRVGAAEGGAEGGGPQWGGSWPTIPCRRGSPLSRSRRPGGCQYQATSPRPAGHARPCTDLDRSKRFGSPPPRTPSRPACSRPAAPKRRCTPRRDWVWALWCVGVGTALGMPGRGACGGGGSGLTGGRSRLTCARPPAGQGVRSAAAPSAAAPIPARPPPRPPPPVPLLPGWWIYTAHAGRACRGGGGGGGWGRRAAGGTGAARVATASRA